MKVVRLSALRTSRLYPPERNPLYLPILGHGCTPRMTPSNSQWRLSPKWTQTTTTNIQQAGDNAITSPLLFLLAQCRGSQWSPTSVYPTLLSTAHYSRLLAPWAIPQNHDSIVGTLIGPKAEPSTGKSKIYQDPINLLLNGYGDAFPGGQASGSWSWALTSK
jgi:hypothetical protein